MQILYAQRRAYLSLLCCYHRSAKGKYLVSLCLAFIRLPLQTLFTIHELKDFWHPKICFHFTSIFCDVQKEAPARAL